MPSDGGRQSLVWRWPALRLALVAVPAWFTIAILVFNVTWRLKLLVGLTLAVTIASPAAGLVAAAAVAPLGQLLAIVVRLEPFRLSEAIMLAFITGWLVRAPGDRPGPAVPAAIGWLLATTIVASVVGLAWQLGQVPGALAETFDGLFHAYYLIAERIGFIDGARLLEGLALVAATVTLFRQRPALSVTLPVVLAGAASVAAITSVLVWRGIAPAAILQRNTLGNGRISAHVADVNAAGSYFALVLCLALGMTVRAHPRHRVAWGAASIACGTGLWFTESRTALAAAGIVILVAAMWYVVVRLRPIVRAAAIGAMLAVALGVVAYRVHAWDYGFENAHNNFLQIGAELGLVGLGLFVAWVGTGLVRAVRALARQPRDARLLGVTCGVAAFVGTWLGGHPLLVSEVAFPFWIQFGLMLGLAGSTLLNAAADRSAVERRAPRAWPRVVAVAMGVCLVLAAPVSAVRGPIDPPDSQEVNAVLILAVAAQAYTPAQQTRPLPAPSDVAAPPPNATTSSTTLAWKVLAAGTGRTHPAATDLVTFSYTAWTSDGKLLDSSFTRGQPSAWPLDQVMPKGLQEGLLQMVAGEKRRFWIPPAIVWGLGRRDLPGGLIVFDVELISFAASAVPTSMNFDAPREATRTASGLAYVVLKPGTGSAHPAATSMVTVHYSGWSAEGGLFDSTVLRDQPAIFRVDTVPAGLAEGLQRMVVGEKARFWIPAELAYTSPGPPHVKLVFDVELLRIQPAGARRD